MDLEVSDSVARRLKTLGFNTGAARTDVEAVLKLSLRTTTSLKSAWIGVVHMSPIHIPANVHPRMGTRISGAHVRNVSASWI